MIMGVEEDEGGTYECIAGNVVGNNSANTSVRIQCKCVCVCVCVCVCGWVFRCINRGGVEEDRSLADQLEDLASHAALRLSLVSESR